MVDVPEPGFTSILPHEIWDMIAKATQLDDLANLRLVSKPMNVAATRPLGLSCLAHRRFIISPYSLQSLVQLTAHPVLGTCLETISLGTWRVNKDFEDSQTVVDGTGIGGAAHEAALVQCPFERDEQHVKVLTQALNNIKHHNIEVGLGMHDDVVHDQVSGDNGTRPTGPDSIPHGKPFLRRAYGFEELYGQLDLSHVGTSEKQATLTTLWHAMYESRCYPEALTFDFDMHPVNDTLSAWNSHLGAAIEAMIIPEDPTTPLFDLTVKLCADPTCTADNWSVHDSIMIIRTDQTLELIRHSFQSPVGPQPPPDVYARPYGSFTPVLHEKWFTEIVLANCKADMSLPYIWLRERSGTLRRLEIMNLHLVGDEGDQESVLLNLWKGVITKLWYELKSMWSLEVLVLDGFYFSDALRSIRIRGKVTWRGAQIGVGLRRLLDMADEWPDITVGTFDMPQVV